MNKKTASKYDILKKIVNRLRLKRLEIRSINEIGDSFVIESTNQENVSVSPKYMDSIPRISKYRVEDIKILHLRDVFCNINSSSYITQNKDIVYMEEFPYINRSKANYASGFIHNHSNDFAYIKSFNRKKTREYRNVFFLGGNGSFNFYHWMIEIAPKLLLLDNNHIDQYQIDTIVVNDCVKNNKNYMWLLEECLSHLKKVNIVYINQKDIFFVNNLYFMNTFNQTIYNYKENNYNQNFSTIYNSKYLYSLEQRLSTNIINNELKVYKKIFILRDENTVNEFNRRTYNEDKVFELFQEEGFVGLYLADLTLIEQAHIFRNADFIVGPSGAAWSNLIFCEKGTKAISWLPESVARFDAYSTLAYLREVEMSFLSYKTIEDSIHSHYLIDTEELNRLYNSVV